MKHSSERLNRGVAIEERACIIGPLTVGEDDVAVEPGDAVARSWDRRERHVEQTLFLPQHVLSPQADVDVCVIVTQLEVFTVGQLDGDQGQIEMLAKDAVVHQAPPSGRRIEVAGDSPHQGCHASLLAPSRSAGTTSV